LQNAKDVMMFSGSALDSGWAWTRTLAGSFNYSLRFSEDILQIISGILRNWSQCSCRWSR
jgi:hypothetical protein